MSSTFVKADKIPVDHEGNVQFYSDKKGVGVVDRETGQMYYPGVDYNVPYGDDFLEYKDFDTRMIINTRCSPVYCEPEWQPAQDFTATLVLEVNRPGYDSVRWRAQGGQELPMFRAHYEELGSPTIGTQIRAKWGFVCKKQWSGGSQYGVVKVADV